MIARRTGRLTARSMFSIATALCALLVGALAVHAAVASRDAKISRRAPAFVVRGTMATELSPGTKAQVKVSVANKKYAAIWIKSLRMSITIDAAHAAAGCSVARDFKITQLPIKTFPLKLAAAKKAKKRRGKKSKAKISWKPVPAKKSKGMPAIEMVNLDDVNQDACKGATLNLKFSAKATNKKPAGKKARA